MVMPMECGCRGRMSCHMGDVEYLKNGIKSVIEWLVRLLNVFCNQLIERVHV